MTLKDCGFVYVDWPFAPSWDFERDGVLLMMARRDRETGRWTLHWWTDANSPMETYETEEQVCVRAVQLLLTETLR